MQPDPAGRVVAPAIGLIVVGALNAVVLVLWMLLLGIFGATIISDPQAREAVGGLGIQMAGSALGLVVSAVMIYAGLQMRKLGSWGLCLAGSIAAMLPCAPCCFVGLPIGIWALIVLFDSDVKRAFSGQGPSGGYGGPGGYGGYPPQGGGYPPQGGGYGGPPQG